MAGKAVQATEAEKMIAAVNKKFGANSIMMARDMPPVNIVSSGSLSLDYALGVGGMPSNRVIELIGPEGGGKTTLALLMARQMLMAYPDRMALYIDMEHKLDAAWMEKLVGAEFIDRFLYLQPDSAEQATDMYVETVKTGQFCNSIFDSIGGAPTLGSMTKSAEVADVGGNAKAISRLARIGAVFSSKYDCMFTGVNQLRDVIGGAPHSTAWAGAPGGKAWRHACIARIELRPNGDRYKSKINGEELQVGYGIRARVFKNQMSAPGRVANWDFYNVDSELGPVGIDTAEECLRLSEVVGVVEVGGGGFYSHAALPGGRIRGRDNLRTAIMGDESLKQTIISEVLAVLQGNDSLISQIAPITDLDIDMDLEAEAEADRSEEPNLVGSGGIKMGLPK